MEITVTRKNFTPNSTIGEMTIDGVFECFTLEDMVRAPGVKIFGKTAIPAGRYEVIVDFSNRFAKPMPHVLNVPGFDGIRIHPGNTDKDTEGCILLGQNKGTDIITRSQNAFLFFFPKLKAGLEAGKVWITITGDPNIRH